MTTRRDAARTLLAAGLGMSSGLSAAQKPAPAPAASGAENLLNLPRLGLALGGGSARGLAHIGVLKSLEQAGIRPAVVAGTSAGSLVGAFFAAGISAFQIEEIALRTREVDITDLTPQSKRGMMAGEALWRFVNQGLREARIEDLKLTYGAIATDLRSGQQVLMRQGLVADAVRASCSIPGVFIPRETAGRELVDGGLTSPLPVQAAQQMGADVVVAVDVAAQPSRTSVSGIYEIVLQSFEIMGRALADLEARSANVVIRPNTSAYASTDFGVRREMIQAGYEATQRALPAIRLLLGRPTPRPRRAG